MSQGPLCPNLPKKVQKEVSQMANRKLSCAMLYRWFLNHLKSDDFWVSGSPQRPQIGPKSPCTWVKKVFLVVSIHIQVNLKVAQNLKKNW